MGQTADLVLRHKALVNRPIDPSLGGDSILEKSSFVTFQVDIDASRGVVSAH